MKARSDAYSDFKLVREVKLSGRDIVKELKEKSLKHNEVLLSNILLRLKNLKNNRRLYY